MCDSCKQVWIDNGAPEMSWGELEVFALNAVEALYKHHPCGGLGHVVFDDMNLDSVGFCLNECAKVLNGPAPKCDGTDEPDEGAVITAILSEAALRAFHFLSEEQRWAVMAQHEGWKKAEA